MEQPRKILCKKLLYKNYDIDNDAPARTTILLGIIVEQDSGFITFRTARREYTISKRCVLSIEDTSEEYIGDLTDEEKLAFTAKPVDDKEAAP